MNLQARELQVIAEFVKGTVGISISADKGYLMETRLLPVVRKHEMNSFEQLAGALQRLGPRSDVREGSGLAYDVVEALTINETSFFRDLKPFQLFRKVILPARVKAEPNAPSLRIWSAACSSGQEPYTLSICALEEAALLGSRSVEIIATDLSQAIMEKAKLATYSQFEVQRGLPVQMLMKYFTQSGEQWQVKELVRKMVEFNIINLTQDFSRLGQFDMILCRNVLIYFEPPTKSDILNRFAPMLKPGGFLMLGSSETVIGLSDKFQPLDGSAGVFTLKK